MLHDNWARGKSIRNEKKRNRGADALYKSLQHQIGDTEVTDLGFGGERGPRARGGIYTAHPQESFWLASDYPPQSMAPQQLDRSIAS